MPSTITPALYLQGNEGLVKQVEEATLFLTPAIIYFLHPLVQTVCSHRLRMAMADSVASLCPRKRSDESGLPQ